MKRRTFTQSLVASAVAASVPFNPALAALSKIKTDIEAVTRTGGQTILPKNEVKDFGKSLHGQLIFPHDANYDAARQVWNGMFDKKPALIAQCSGAADVMKAVDFARDNDLLVAVKGGGHSMSGKSTCEGGILIDLSQMKGVRVDPYRQTATAEPGTLLGQFDTECQAFGLATTMGTDPDTGAAGLTLGGGFGRLGRKYGLACDNVLSVDIVTADGKFMRANAEQNPDLYWAVRGGGGNFGIVTAFEYQLHPIGNELFAANFMYPLAKANDLINFYNEFTQEIPDDLTGTLVYVMPPGKKEKPRGFVGMNFLYTGADPKEAEKLIAPMKKFAKPMRETVGMQKYLKMQTRSGAPLPRGDNYYMKSGFIGGATSDFADIVTEHYTPDTSRSTTFVLNRLGGAQSRVPIEDTAFAHRDSEYDFIIASHWKKDEFSDANVSFMRNFWKKTEPFTKGFYVNSAMDVTDSKIKWTYRQNYDRLVKLKNQYDPKNLFQLNTNIKPTV